MNTDIIHTGDAFDVLPDLLDESIHACVTDPPYGLAFMGRDWDDFEPKEYQEWCEEWAREVKRVLKPGGHLLAFSGNRTHHRLFAGVEDAGFEIRDTITWHYGSGFPKALDVSKQDVDGWDGFKTALKPATEYVVVARKPLSEGTIAENVQTHGTGALNIDGTRVEAGERPDRSHDGTGRNTNSMINKHRDDPTSPIGDSRTADGTTTEGRYPSNVVFDELAAGELDTQVGTLESGATPKARDGIGSERVYQSASGQEDLEERIENDAGGPSRYFYTSKASKAERTLDGKIDNAHPTVKPADLMEWLVTLVTAEGQTVLDPFAGSGTTCRAAKDLARRFVGVERQAKWADVARVRCGLTPDDPSVVRDDDAQSGMGDWT
jgi:site-specific DNA-methyltransferase (adenine-specific)